MLSKYRNSKILGTGYGLLNSLLKCRSGVLLVRSTYPKAPTPAKPSYIQAGVSPSRLTSNPLDFSTRDAELLFHQLDRTTLSTSLIPARIENEADLLFRREVNPATTEKNEAKRAS